MAEKKTEPQRVISISLPPKLLARLDSRRWKQRLTRSGAIQKALEGYLEPEKGAAPGR